MSNIPLSYVIADIDFSFPQVWKKSLSYHKNYPFNRDLTKQLGFTNYVHRNKQYSFLEGRLAKLARALKSKPLELVALYKTKYVHFEAVGVIQEG